MSLRPFSFNPVPRSRGQLLDDTFPPEISAELHADSLPTVSMIRRLLRNTLQNIDRPIGSSKTERQLFAIMLNVVHFKPSEVEVKIIDNYIIIHGKHEEKMDEHGFVTREFTRRYLLPAGTEPDSVKPEFTPNGILTIQATRTVIQLPDRNERIVPISIEMPVEKGKELDKKYYRPLVK